MEIPYKTAFGATVMSRQVWSRVYENREKTVFDAGVRQCCELISAVTFFDPFFISIFCCGSLNGGREAMAALHLVENWLV
jgi:hypothetical protein